eukprot:CAMPEP_0183470242 /NCGR_PEP_ID=MMETSP0370-20130417/155874_1 /TAXON_ID=268820 /ORGANISM="Peridinium aciculiferum, Strain PAER-2" /LENGTH=37 /DNA_ID= /DNA_START= /DNA_END= /DNA_ORIENTATION=
MTPRRPRNGSTQRQHNYQGTTTNARLNDYSDGQRPFN